MQIFLTQILRYNRNMGLAVKFLKCHGGCRNCYEADLRKCHVSKYDITHITSILKEQMKKTKGDGLNAPVIHGGEPLMINVKDLEVLLEEVYKERLHTTVQTSLAQMTKEHLALFKKYKTHVGVSIDGDTAQMNQGHWNGVGSVDMTFVEKMTKKTLENMTLLKESGVGFSVISLLRTHNASVAQIEDFIRFLKRLRDEFGVVHIRTNPVIGYSDITEELSNKELSYAFSKIAEFTFSSPIMMIRPVRDITDSLIAGKSVTCNFKECDPYFTHAEVPIFESGQLGNCLKTGAGKDAVLSMRADSFSNERYLMLKRLPQKNGGCKDCEFWNICTGGCTGEALHDDWRYRTRFCGAWKDLFKDVKHRMKSLFPNLTTIDETGDENAKTEDLLKSISVSVFDSNEKIEYSRTEQNEHAQRNSVSHADIPHGDGYSDSNRPWTLKDPQNNKERPLNEKK